MFIRPLSRFVAHIPQASTSRLLAFSKYPSFHVVSSLASANARLHTVSESTKKPNNREILYTREFESTGKVRNIDLCFDPENGHYIFLRYIRYAFLTPNQTRVILEKLDEAVKGPEGLVFKDEVNDLRIRKSKTGTIDVKIVTILIEAVPSVKENLAAVLEEYEKLKAEGKLRT